MKANRSVYTSAHQTTHFQPHSFYILFSFMFKTAYLSGFPLTICDFKADKAPRLNVLAYEITFNILTHGPHVYITSLTGINFQIVALSVNLAQVFYGMRLNLARHVITSKDNSCSCLSNCVYYTDVSFQVVGGQLNIVKEGGGVKPAGRNMIQSILCVRLKYF